MKRFLPDIAALCILFCLVMAFFARLFYPTPQLLVTPDYGRSDAWHFSMPTKFALSQSLKKGELPLWRDDAGTGFPLFAEGQTGALFLPNLILFRYLDWVTAYNSILALSIFTLGAGFFFLLRVLGVVPIGALFGAISISFSGLPILNLPHVTLLQGMSLLPWIVGTGIIALRKKQLYYYMIVCLLVSQQVFAGFPQSVFLTMCVLYLYAVFHGIQNKSYKETIFLILATCVGLLGASAQLLPSYEFLKSSVYPTGFDQETASWFSMPLSHLVTFINPYFFGNPKLGTYPPFNQFDGSMFWENTAYVGIFPLLFALYWFLKTSHKDTRFYLSLILGSLLFAWGKHSPIYLLYGVWPLTLFRVPSRFLWITIVGILIVASMQVSSLWTQSKYKNIKYIILFILFLQTFILLFTWWSYHLYIDKNTLLKKPIQTPDKSVRILTIGDSTVHNLTFVKNGWVNSQKYIPLYQGSGPISNMFYHTSSYGIYAGRFLLRKSLFNEIFNSQIQMSEKTATMSASSVSLLSSSGIQEVHSFLPISNELLVEKQKYDTDPPLIVYTNANALTQAYMAHEASTASTVREAASALLNPFFASNKTAVISTYDASTIPMLNDAIQHIKELPTSTPVIIKRPSHTRVEISLSAQNVPSILVLSDMYYPDWKATVNGKDTQIFPINITYRGLVIPKGSDEIIFSYAPKSVKLGIQLSLLTHLFIVIAVVCRLIFSIFRIQKKDSQLLSRLSNNRDA